MIENSFVLNNMTSAGYDRFNRLKLTENSVGIDGLELFFRGESKAFAFIGLTSTSSPVFDQFECPNLIELHSPSTHLLGSEHLQ